MWTSCTTPVIRASRSRTITWSCGMCRRSARLSSRSEMQSRRDFLKAGGMVLAGFELLPNVLLRSPNAVEEIEMRSDTAGSHVWFDPIGLYVDPGVTVRWIARENVHTATAYH